MTDRSNYAEIPTKIFLYSLGFRRRLENFYKNFFFLAQFFYVYESWVLILPRKSQEFELVVGVTYERGAEADKHVWSVRGWRGNWTRHATNLAIGFSRESRGYKRARLSLRFDNNSGMAQT